MKDFLIAIASFLVVGLSNSYSIPPDEVHHHIPTPIANVSEARLIFAHVVSALCEIMFIYLKCGN